MLRFIKLLILLAIMVVIVTLALANRGPVTLNLMPEGLSQITQVSVQVPMFAVILAAALAGLLLGYILEWLREHKHRRLAAQKRREAERLAREVEALKKKHMSPEDEVLAILDRQAG